MFVSLGLFSFGCTVKLPLSVSGPASNPPVNPGVIYYVDSTLGNDSNIGTTASKPWRTIGKVSGFQFSSGSTISFQGGQTFNGTLYLNAPVAGTAASPITFNSYGTGAATINAGNGSAVSIYDTSGFSFSNLNFVGSGVATNTSNGINVYNDLAGNVKLPYLHFDNLTITGFGGYGISIGGNNGTSGFDNVSVTNSVIHDNNLGGITTYGNGSLYALSNVLISKVVVYNNLGQAGLSNSSGHGIQLGSVQGALVQYCEVYNNGTNNTSASGPVGIWSYQSTNIIFQYNESHHNHTNGGDGDGFDFDGGTTNSVMQYNYSHDNDGAGLYICEYAGASTNSGNTIRYNVSENDSRKVGYGAISLYSTSSNNEIYNNTVYLTPASAGSPSAISTVNWTGGSNVHFRNNILQTTGGVPLIKTSEGAGMLFQGNDYWSTGGAFAIADGGTNYGSLAAWQAAKGMEKVSGSSVGFSADPNFTSPGGGGTIGTATNLSSLAAYRFSGGASPMINAGLNLNTLSGLNIGLSDFYGNSPFNGTGYAVGAYEH